MSNIGNREDRIKNFDWSISEKDLGYEKGKTINIGWHCSDRICQIGKADHLAFIWENSSNTVTKKYTYDDLRQLSNTIATYLTDKLGAPEFSEADRLLVEMFSLRAGIAIENARLHEQVQRLAVVEERERISRDLHDGIIQAIYGVALSLEDVPSLMATDPTEAEVRVDRAIDSLNLAIREIRNFILGLRSELLHGADVVAGLATLAEEFAVTGAADVELDLAVDPEVTAGLPMPHRVQLLQMSREALSNAARHARASRIRLAMRDTEGVLELSVEDDGVGFDAAEEPPAGHLGLANLRQRAAALGGIMSIESSPGSGTRLSIRIPLTSEERSE